MPRRGPASTATDAMETMMTQSGTGDRAPLADLLREALALAALATLPGPALETLIDRIGGRA